MSNPLSRRSQVDSFIAMDIMAAAAAAERTGRDIAHLEVGQPGTPAPAKAREAAIAALKSGEPLGYTEALGNRALRERIARMYAEVHGLSVPAERIVVTTGSSAGFLLAFLSVMEAGDRLALADPGYPSYRNILRSIDIEPVSLPATLADGYQPTPAQLAEARGEGPIKALLVASPANPTGTMLSREQVQALIDDCNQHDTTLISDEIYDRLTYGIRPTSALALSDTAIVINSFSKFHCMTGWRIGWMVVPEALIRTVERLAQNHFICPPHVSQVAALAAMDCEAELSGHLKTYLANRALLLEALPGLGFRDFAPADGAFYLYGDVSDLTADSAGFARRMLDEAGVAAVPGIDFDPARGAQTMRFSFAGSRETVEKAVERLDRWLGSRGLS
jgi:aspartate/methionine/tyrosine aminotransferase